jgi:hypothetical protein
MRWPGRALAVCSASGEYTSALSGSGCFFEFMNVRFDLDGTLTDPREGIVGCLHYALERMVGCLLDCRSSDCALSCETRGSHVQRAVLVVDPRNGCPERRALGSDFVQHPVGTCSDSTGRVWQHVERAFRDLDRRDPLALPARFPASVAAAVGVWAGADVSGLGDGGASLRELGQTRRAATLDGVVIPGTGCACDSVQGIDQKEAVAWALG